MRVAEAQLPQHIHFLCHGGQGPVALAVVEHIGGEARRYDFPVRLFLPVNRKRIEIVVAEIHHREERIHHARAQPFLRVLADRGARIPSARRIATQIVVLADGRTAHHHPRLQLFHASGNCLGNARDMASPLLPAHLDFPRFRIADIVEVDAVNVVFFDDFLADVGQIGCRLRFFGVEIALVANLPDEARIAFPQFRATRRAPFSDGNRHHPRVQLHSALVTLVDGELQRVVARISPCRAAQTAVPRLQVRRIDCRGAHARLQEHHVDACGLELVENRGEFLLLPFHAACRPVGERFRPVESVERCQPDGSHFVFRRRGEHGRLLGTGIQKAEGDDGRSKYDFFHLNIFV